MTGAPDTSGGSGPEAAVHGGPEGEGSELLTRFAGRRSIVIGRDTECDLIISDLKASRKHCRLTREERVYIIEDLGSRNGTYVDGKRITQAVELRPHQVFKIGDTVFFLSDYSA